MKFSHDLDYDAAPDEVAAMLADPAFREKVCVAVHVLRHEVAVTGSTGGGTPMTVVVDQTQPTRGVPTFAQKFVGEEIRILRRETWSDDRRATLEMEVPGKPGTVTGTIRLAAGGAGTRQSVTGDVTVKVPLIGGRLEGLIGDILASALRAEHRVGRSWLAGER